VVRASAVGRAYSNFQGSMREHRNRLRRVGLVIAIVVFIGGLTLSLHAAPELVSQAKIAPFLVVLLVIQPMSSAVNVADFRLIARMSGAHVGWFSALQTVIYARAASFLPLPGGFVTRVAALKLHDIPLARGSATTALITGLWGALAFCYSGAWLSIRGDQIGLAFVGIGAIGLVACSVVARRLQVHIRLIALSAMLRIFALIIEATSLVWAARTFGLTFTFDQTSVFVVSSFLATATVIAPDGLGIREAVIAFLSPLVGIDPSTGFLTAAAGRVAGLLGMAATATIVYLMTLRTVRGNP